MAADDVETVARLFEVGQEAECKSFQAGFRGAWFRCRIHDAVSRRGSDGYFLDYFDFPDEKRRWIQLYQKPKYKVLGEKKHMMLRPSFPAIYKKSEMPDASMISESVVVVSDEWKNGDLIDWWKDECYWSGKIVQLLGNDKVQIELPKPPFGEGEVYEANIQDLRPSLNWSCLHGWTIPTSEENDIYSCAFMLKPLDQGGLEMNEPTGQDMGAGGQEMSVLIDQTMGESEPSTSQAAGEGVRSSENASTSDDMSLAASREGMNTASENEKNSSPCPSKRARPSEESTISNASSETIESSILKLEEYVNKFKWLQGVLQSGDWLNTSKPSWEFLDKPSTSLKRK